MNKRVNPPDPKKYSIAEAKAHLSEILRFVEAGENIAITRHGKVIAELHPHVSERKCLLGALKGDIWVASDFDAPLEEFGEYME